MRPAPDGILTLDSLQVLSEAGRLFAVLDACDQPEVPVLALELGQERAVSLYRGTAEEAYWDIAPYFVRVDAEVLEWIHAIVWDQPWGFFAVVGHGPVPAFESLRTHLRRFLTVNDPAGDEMLFRFYDPRVLPGYAEVCEPDELDRFLGPFTQYVVAATDSDDLRAFGR